MSGEAEFIFWWWLNVSILGGPYLCEAFYLRVAALCACLLSSIIKDEAAYNIYGLHPAC